MMIAEAEHENHRCIRSVVSAAERFRPLPPRLTAFSARAIGHVTLLSLGNGPSSPVSSSARLGIGSTL
jgi:hypothetical protein